ncbi:MAG: TIGR01777 family protein [Burkholderiaceae bacterium]|nr:TIGR01777 family protein [Microbacteriaceae bacterium]
MRVLVSGASGLVGTELTRQLTEHGHDVHTLVRRAPRAENEHNWAPSAGMLDEGVMDSMHAVINLSGASIGRIPWTPRYKKLILESRLQTTHTLAQAMSRSATPPSVFLSASAVGIYGDRPGERLSDDATRGEGFLADVVEAWEDASKIRPEKTRLVNLRTGLVVGNGGAMKPLMLETKFFLGSRIGTGGQHWPWISLYDEAAAIRHLLTSTLSGPVNLAGPVPATSDRLTSAMAREMKRPYALVLPETVVSLAMGEAGRALLLPSQKMLPSKLISDGFTFRHSTVEEAVEALLAR